jgi:hypothetical protein
VRRLQRIRERGYGLATVMSLSTNQASLGNLAKQQFEVVERTALYEHPLPQPALAAQGLALTSRPIERGDRAAFTRLDLATMPPLLLEVRDAQRGVYFRSPGDRAMDRLSSVRTWRRVFEQDGQVVGFLAAERNLSQSKGLIHPPVVADEHVPLLPQMLHEAGAWLAQQGAQAAQVMLFESRAALLACVEALGWARVLTWVELVKRLD